MPRGCCVAGVDTDGFTPKMVQVAVQSALANADPPALCPIEDGIGKYEPNIRALVQAMCSSLAGEPDTAAGQIDEARRHGRIGGIDLNLADKVVGAGANTGRAVSIEWDPVDSLTAWRFGLATATGMVPPDRLINSASPQLRAFQARAPLLYCAAAAGLRVHRRWPWRLFLAVDDRSLFIDLRFAPTPTIFPAPMPGSFARPSSARTRTRGSPRSGTCSRRARTRCRKRRCGRSSLARRRRIDPDAKLEGDAPELISAMLAAGYDQAAARWAAGLRRG